MYIFRIFPHLSYFLFQVFINFAKNQSDILPEEETTTESANLPASNTLSM